MRNLTAAIALSVLVICGSAFGQSVAGLGAISGTVRDASGAAVPGAQVVVANESKGIRRTMSTTEAGVFTAPSLVPATGYTVVVTKDGQNYSSASVSAKTVGGANSPTIKNN